MQSKDGGGVISSFEFANASIVGGDMPNRLKIKAKKEACIILLIVMGVPTTNNPSPNRINEKVDFALRDGN